MRFYQQSSYHIDLYENLLPVNEFHASISFLSNTLMRLITDISLHTYSNGLVAIQIAKTQIVLFTRVFTWLSSECRCIYLWGTLIWEAIYHVHILTVFKRGDTFLTLEYRMVSCCVRCGWKIAGLCKKSIWIWRNNVCLKSRIDQSTLEYIYLGSCWSASRNVMILQYIFYIR